jgi:hypothetical protein
MDTIKFTTNWNKKLETDNFTTIRLENPYKYKLGEVYEIKQEVRGQLVNRGKGKIIQLVRIKLHQLKEINCYLDTGYGLDATKDIIYKMYPGKDWTQQNLYYMLIQKVKETTQTAKLF